ncbi:hypothetical protein FPV67DRAFT_1512485 [Lyophyllum atratum]|nr:hypothetical protein FPV67DRAFT_1512485 [Lyophyllum atratum]
MLPLCTQGLRLQRMVLLRWFACALVALQSQAALQNITIDDTFGDPLSGQKIVYQPAGAWNTIDCVPCTARPDTALAFNGTWHDGTFYPAPGSNDFPNTPLSASVTFNGTAVYVICILARTTATPFGDSNMTFVIDGNVADTFVKPAPGTTGFDYNVTVYSNPSLEPGTHTITIQNGHVNGPKSIMIIDRIIYTTDIPDLKPTRFNNAGVIAGAVVGSVVFVLAVALLLVLLYRTRRRRLNEKHEDHQIHPFIALNPPTSYGASSADRPHVSSGPSNTSISPADAPPAYDHPSVGPSSKGRSVYRTERL